MILCEEGEFAVGGGFDVTAFDGGSRDDLIVTANHPVKERENNITPIGWLVVADNPPDGSSGSVGVRPEVVCVS